MRGWPAGPERTLETRQESGGMSSDPPSWRARPRPGSSRRAVTVLTSVGLVSFTLFAWAGDAAAQDRAADLQVEFPPAGETTLKTIGDDTLYLLTSPLRVTLPEALAGGGIALAVGGLALLDGEIRDAAKHRRSDTIGETASGVAALGYAPVLLGVNLLTVAVGEGIREYSGDSKLLDTALVATEAQLLTLALSEGLAYATARSRPEDSRDPFRFEFGKDSFPSSHASQAFAVAAVLADRYPQPVGAIAYGVAGLVGVSRIVEDKHWASDVAAGALLGWAIGRALSRRHATPHPFLDFFPFADPVDKRYGLVIRGEF